MVETEVDGLEESIVTKFPHPHHKVPMMQYAVYADMSRGLTEHERSALFEALDVFSLEAPSEAAASTQAAHYMNLILQKARIDLEHTLTLERRDHP